MRPKSSQHGVRPDRARMFVGVSCQGEIPNGIPPFATTVHAVGVRESHHRVIVLQSNQPAPTGPSVIAKGAARHPGLHAPPYSRALKERTGCYMIGYGPFFKHAQSPRSLTNLLKQFLQTYIGRIVPIEINIANGSINRKSILCALTLSDNRPQYETNFFMRCVTPLRAQTLYKWIQARKHFRSLCPYSIQTERFNHAVLSGTGDNPCGNPDAEFECSPFSGVSYGGRKYILNGIFNRLPRGSIIAISIACYQDFCLFRKICG